MKLFRKSIAFDRHQSQPKQQNYQETLILEPILTPSGLVDGGEDNPDPIMIEGDLPDEIENEIDSEIETPSEEDLTHVEVSNINEVEEEIPFITDLEELDVEDNSVKDNSETSEDNLAESNEETISEAESSSELSEDSKTEITESTSNTESLSEVEETLIENKNETTSPPQETAEVSTLEEPLTEETVSEVEETFTESTLQEESELEETENTTEYSLDASTEETEVSNSSENIKPNETEIDSNSETDIVEQIASSAIDFNFDSGIFTVGEMGEIGIDYLFDGGKFSQGELAIFSLEGMEELDLSLEEFIKEAANRALSDSELGHVVISDANEGAKFSGELGEKDFNQGEYLGIKTFDMRPGDQFAVMLVPNGKVQDVFNNPSLEGRNQPLFSLSNVNPEDGFQLGQIADVTGDGNTFAFEDLRIDNNSDRDYNDIIFQVRGATGEAVNLDEVISDKKDWRSDDLGQALIEYAKPYITPEEPIVEIENNLSNLLNELEDLLDEEEFETEIESDEEVSNSETVETEVINEIARISEEEEYQDEFTELVESNEPEVEELEVIEIEDNLETPIVEESSSQLEETEVEENVPTSAVEEIEESEVIEIEDSGDTPVFEESSSQLEETEVEENVPTAVVEEIEESEVIEIEDSGDTPIVQQTENSEITQVEDNLETSIVQETEKQVVVETENNSESYTSPTEAIVIDESSDNLNIEETEESEVIEIVDNSDNSVVEEAEESEVIEIVDHSETSVVGEVESNLENPLTEESKPELEKTEVQETTETSFVEKAEQLESVSFKENSETSGVEETEKTELIDVDSSSESSVLPIEITEIEDIENTFSEIPPTSTIESPAVNLVGRLENLTYNLQNQTLSEIPVNSNLVQQLEQLTNRLKTQSESNLNLPVSSTTLQLIEQLETQLITEPTSPASVEAPVKFEFPTEHQPLIGIIDTGFSADNPDIDYSRITWGQDHVDGDSDPTLTAGEGNEHGTHILGLIAAEQDNDIGIDGINNQAPIWAGRAIGSGKWAESLVEFVDAAVESGQPNAVVNLSLDLTQIDAEGNVTTRYEFTPTERAAIEYARQNGVLLVAAAGNDGGVMSALGQASQEFDNIITVGAVEQFDPNTSAWKGANRTDYSSYGNGLDITAYGGTADHPELSLSGDDMGTMSGTSVATAKVTGAISQVWAANRELSYRQVIEIVKNTATDLGVSGWDTATGAGLLNIAAAVSLAKVTTPEEHSILTTLIPKTWGGEGRLTPGDRAVAERFWKNGKYYDWVSYQIQRGDTLSAIALETIGGATPDYYNWIAQHNGISNPNHISQGKWIEIPKLAPTPTPPPQPQPTPTPTPKPPTKPQPTPTPTPQPPADLDPIAAEAIMSAYQQRKTELGQPTSEPVNLGNGFLKQNFERGYIVWNGNQAIAYITGSPTLTTSKDEWTVQYWNNTNLSGTPVWTMTEPPGEILFSAGLGAPPGTQGVAKDNFSARWETTSHFEGGFYNFISKADDGIRVYVDGVKVVDKWKAAEPWSRRDAYIAIPEGDHNIVVEYFEKGGSAAQSFKWEASGLLNDWTGDFRPVGYDGQSVDSTFVNTYQRNGAILQLGYPINNVYVWEGGHTQDFEGGSVGRGAIMKSNADENSYWVGEKIWTKFIELGGAKYLGYPTTDAIPVPGGLDNSGGKVQYFRGAEGIASKIWLSQHGAHPTWGAIGGRYDEMGGSSSWLGFPTSKEQGIGNRWVRQDFEGGYMLWHPQQGVTVYNTKAIDTLPPDSGNSSTSNWHAQYWDNKELTGSPDWSQYEEMSDLRFHAGRGAPVGTQGIEEDTFGGRWITTSYFDGGIYNFINKADDGVRVYVDGQLIIDKWKDSPFEEKRADAAIEPGYHQVMVEYYDNRHSAANHLRWEQANTPNEWAVEYFRGKDLNPKNLAGHRGGGTGFIDKNWGRGKEAGISTDTNNFSDRWTTTRYFEEPGVYEFDSKADDGIRVWVDDKLVIDKWIDQGYLTNKALVSLDKGYHQIRVEHYDNKWSSALKLDWKKVAGEPTPVYRIPESPLSHLDAGLSGWLEPWTVEYFNNPDLQGAPVLTRQEETKLPFGRVSSTPSQTQGFDLDWRKGSPDATVNADNFSSRMTSHRYLPGGTYKFNLKGDDGIRLYINGEKVIDRWENPPFGTPHEEEIVLPKGLHRIEVEHSENYGLAYAGLDWDYLSNTVAHSPAPEVETVYAELENQLGQGAVGVAISDLQQEYYRRTPADGGFVNMGMLSASYQEFRGTRGRGAIFTDGGHYVSGKLWEAYQNGGGVAQFGVPLASEKDLGNGAYELKLPNGILFWAPGMTNPTYYEYAKANPKTLTIPADAWRGEYFDNQNWSGDPLVVRQDSISGGQLEKFWGGGSPAPGLPEDLFSVRWTSNRPFDRGTYRFKGEHDDGFIVEVNKQKAIDKMQEVATVTTGYASFQTGGQYGIEVKHREYRHSATAKLTYEKASDYVVGLDKNNRKHWSIIDGFNRNGGYAVLGVPVNNVKRWNDSGYIQDYNLGPNGAGILMQRDVSNKAYYVFGKIRDAYLKAGGPAKLGYPTGDRFNDGYGNTAQEFENNRITQRPNGETFVGGYINGHRLPGDFYRVWKQYKGTIGKPLEGVQYSNGSQYIRFEKGSIVSSKYGTFPLSGGIRSYFVNTTGGLGGPLGAPKSAEYSWGGGTRQDFAGGYILWKGGQAIGYRPDGSLLYPPSSSDGGNEQPELTLIRTGGGDFKSLLKQLQDGISKQQERVSKLRKEIKTIEQDKLKLEDLIKEKQEAIKNKNKEAEKLERQWWNPFALFNAIKLRGEVGQLQDEVIGLKLLQEGVDERLKRKRKDLDNTSEILKKYEKELQDLKAQYRHYINLESRKNDSKWWDRVGGSSAQYGKYAQFINGDKRTDTMPSDVLKVYEDLSTAILKSPRKVNTGYAYDESYYPRWGAHSGIDIQTEYREPLYSATKGEVVHAEYYYNTDGSHNGKWIAVDELTEDGKRTGRRWWYGHLDNDQLVTVGQKIEAGHQIGVTGNNKGLKHHLHLTVIDTYSPPPATWNEVRNGKYEGGYDADVRDVLSRTVSPLHAYWKSIYGVKE